MLGIVYNIQGNLCRFISYLIVLSFFQVVLAVYSRHSQDHALSLDFGEGSFNPIHYYSHTCSDAFGAVLLLYLH